MTSSMRTTRSLSERSQVSIILVGTGFLVSACSADVTRFDFPAFGLGNGNSDSTESLPAPPEPIYQFEPDASGRPKLTDQTYSQNDTRSNLGRSDIEVEALPTPRRSQSPSYGLPSRNASADDARITVQRGDTLYGIARRTGVSVSRIKQANGLAGNQIRVGQKLIIPGRSPDWSRAPASPQPIKRAARSTFGSETANGGASDDTYRVRPGDSLYAIARRTGVKSDRLAEFNDIADPSRLQVGQILNIPGGTSTMADDFDRPVDVATITSRKPRRVASLRKTDGFGDYTTASIGRPKASNVQQAGFRWPVRGRIISRFGEKLGAGDNDGINVAVPAGTSVKAVETGVVAYAGSELKGYGKLLLIRHENDWVSAYAHNSELLVKRGDKIRRGQIIAKAGRTGSVERPQVHFELRKGSKPVDPLIHLARR